MTTVFVGDAGPRPKFDFYFRVGVEDVLLVDPHERIVEWYVRAEGGFVAADGSALLGVTAQQLHDDIEWPH